MKKFAITTTLLMILASAPFALVAAEASTPTNAAPAAAAAPALKDPNVEQRLADLEAYMGNGARSSVANTNISSKIPGPGPGHNAFQMVCAALVLFMTLPGLALFYGGLVRRKNVLSVLAQCLGIAGLVAILWWLFGYSMVFSRQAAGNSGEASTFFGNLKTFAFLNGVDSSPNTDYSYWVSHNVFSMYQLMFAIITPALLVGAIAERMKFSAILAFMALWML